MRASVSGGNDSPLSIFLFISLLLLCVTPWISAPIALALGLLLALTFGAPFPQITRKWTKILLQVCVVGLGFGMNLESVLQAGKMGVGVTVITLVGTLAFGLLLGRLLNVDKKIAWLISCGTAICGGSAIAAIGPVLRADAKQMSVSLGTIFILNAIALFIFPVIGHALGLTQMQFGMWGAIAIHDTSSVVGAATRYGSQALQVATTIKLTRALWIIPLALAVSRFGNERNGDEGVTSEKRKVTIPWFILFFVLAVIGRTLLGDVGGLFPGIAVGAKQGMVVTLFLIGAGLSRDVLKGVGIRPFVLGILLWVSISVATLALVLAAA